MNLLLRYLIFKAKNGIGGFIMIDDFLNVDNNGKTIMSALFSNYELNKNIFF